MPDLSFTASSILNQEVDLLAIPVSDGCVLGAGGKELEAELGDLNAILEQAPLLWNPFTGALGEVVAIPTLGKIAAKTVLLVGIGAKNSDAAVARKVGAVLARRCGGAQTVATTLPQAFRGDSAAVFERFWEGFLLASYRYKGFKRTNTERPNRVTSVSVVTKAKPETRSLKTAATRAETLAAATNLTRDLINTPSSHKAPAVIADEARRVAKDGGLSITVLDEKQLASKGFGGLVGVGQGSSKPPRFVELRYEPKGATKTVALVGKGITFDSGGLDLKPAAGMLLMKTDMSGAATVLGVMQAIAILKPKVAIRGYLCLAENMPDGNALRPGDVITHYGGTTSEIGNTDAEGRLVLADGIAYAKEQGADVIVDIATLTGAISVALGGHIYGVMSNDPKTAKALLKAADTAGEPAWELPMFPGYRPFVAGKIADLYNTENAPIGAGAITAAWFLAEFAGDTPWAHLDIAGAARSPDDRFEVTKGASGVAVRSVVEFLMTQAR